MKKLLLFLSFTLIIFFSLNVCESFAFAPFNVPVYAADAVNKDLKALTAKDSPQANKLSIPQKNKYTLTHLEKNGFKYKFFKFLLSMLGVLISSVAIFLGLKFYKNFILKNASKPDNIDYGNNLESPKNFKEAINLFLNKTDK